MSFKWLARPLPISAGFVAFALSLTLGLALSLLLGITAASSAERSPASTRYGMVDPTAPQLEASYRTYINECATCHVALPPAVLPTQTWQTLVVDPAHYGLTLTDITAFEKQLIINYLQAYSRPHPSDSLLPFRLKDSEYFYALHPQVTLPQPLNLRTCTSCHLSAATQNYRDLISDPALEALP